MSDREHFSSLLIGALASLKAMSLIGRPPRRPMRLGNASPSPFKDADAAKKAARKRQKKARAITRRER